MEFTTLIDQKLCVGLFGSKSVLKNKIWVKYDLFLRWKDELSNWYSLDDAIMVVLTYWFMASLNFRDQKLKNT